MLPSFLLILIHLIRIIQNYTFNSSIDNLLYVSNTSTLYAISSSHLHQLHWSTVNQTLLLLHRRVQLHSALDHVDQGVSVFLYESSNDLLLICSRSDLGRCIFYDANDISRVYVLDSTIDTNYLGCSSGCYTFFSSNILRSALNGNRRERNGNIINSEMEFQRDQSNFNIKYQFQSSDHTLITSLTFLSENLPELDYIYGFDYRGYTYYLLRSSRLARLCQTSVAMRMTYEEIPLIHCQINSMKITGAFHSFDSWENLYIIYENHVCIYTMNEILRAFHDSKLQCHRGIGYRLGFILDSDQRQVKCEKINQGNTINGNECTWQADRKNTYMNGTIGANGELLYQANGLNVNVVFIFAWKNLVIIGTSEQHVLKFIRLNETVLHLLHQTNYLDQPLGNQYVIDDQHQSLVFPVGTTLYRYAYNSCAIYDTCQSCVGSRRYESNSCMWFNGECTWGRNPFVNDRGCPPRIDRIQPMNASVNSERVLITMTGSFGEMQKNFVKVAVRFPRSNQHEYFCTIETIEIDSLTCHLTVPRQPAEGVVSIDVQPGKILSAGDTDVSGSMEFSEKFHVYIPKAILDPDYGPAAGGTKIQIKNINFSLYSTVKIYLGEKECPISHYDYQTNEIECVNQACENDIERLELSIRVNDHPWQLEKTFFQCRANPVVFDWSPKRGIMSGGMKLTVSGQNLDVVQKPTLKSIYNSSIYEFTSPCEIVSTAQMICLSPGIDRNLELNTPLDLDVSFVMDNMKIVPDQRMLTIVPDPHYFPFEDSVQQINSSNILQFEGLNLTSSHSLDQINIRIGNINHACVPFNLTDSSLFCSLSKLILKNFTNSEPAVDIIIGTNLTFPMGRLQFVNASEPTLLNIPRHFTSQTMIILIILSSMTILTLVFALVISTRRHLRRGSRDFQKETKPPEYYKTIWLELGKNRQIDRKKVTLYEKIGQGCFGDVYRGELKSTDQKIMEVAVKLLRDQNVAAMEEFLSEANRMKDFSHPNVLSLVGVSWDPIRKALVLLPYMKNGDLRSYISNDKNRPTVRQLITWGIQVADGMEYLASLKFVHRDLATRNCMLDEELICRISDFGLTRDIVDRDYYLVPTTVTKNTDGKTVQATPRRLPIRWLSPESIESSKYTIQSDVWSFGVLLWELMSRGKMPYPGIDNADIYAYVKKGYRLQQPTYCPALLFKSAMSICWHADPAQRPSFTQLAHDIRHILHQLELEQQQRQQSSSADDDDTTIIQRYPIDRKIKRLSTTTLSSTSSIGGQYITTPHRQSENVQLLFDRRDDHDDDPYTVTINANAEMFSTTRLLPEYTETSIAEDV